MEPITAFGAIAGLILTIVLIFRKVPPAYSMMLGAFIGALLGGANLTDTVATMISGAQGIIPSVIRILSAGVLAGVLIGTGAADRIAHTVVSFFGQKRVFIALAVSTMVLTAVGVFVDVAVITVAPIALAVGKDAKLSRTAVLLALIGGGKAGNVISPNPNAIALASAFNLELTKVMVAGIIPAILGLIAAIALATHLNKKRSDSITEEVSVPSTEVKGSFLAAVSGPVVAIVLLALRPLAGIAIDPFIALPAGALVTAIAMKDVRNISAHSTDGLSRMSGVAIMLLGTGTLAGVIKASGFSALFENLVQGLNLPSIGLAPISGMAMSFATASTTAGATVASEVFGPTLTELGVGAVVSAVLIHTGATVLDHMPHGSFFHSTAGAMNVGFKERLKLIPYESAVGLVMVVAAVIFVAVGVIG